MSPDHLEVVVLYISWAGFLGGVARFCFSCEQVPIRSKKIPKLLTAGFSNCYLEGERWHNSFP